jgi:serine/threonine-protein kinase HipA
VIGSRIGRVSLDGVPVGTIREQDDGRETAFTYDPEWLANPEAVPISLTIPLGSSPVVSKGLHPFFENLLPEGWLLNLSTDKFKIAPDDAFGLLLAVCADCVGAVEVTDPTSVEIADEEAAR